MKITGRWRHVFWGILPATLNVLSINMFQNSLKLYQKVFKITLQKLLEIIKKLLNGFVPLLTTISSLKYYFQVFKDYHLVLSAFSINSQQFQLHKKISPLCSQRLTNQLTVFTRKIESFLLSETSTVTYLKNYKFAI